MIGFSFVVLAFVGVDVFCARSQPDFVVASHFVAPATNDAGRNFNPVAEP